MLYYAFLYNMVLYKYSKLDLQNIKYQTGV